MIRPACPRAPIAHITTRFVILAIGRTCSIMTVTLSPFNIGRRQEYTFSTGNIRERREEPPRHGGGTILDCRHRRPRAIFATPRDHLVKWITPMWEVKV